LDAQGSVTEINRAAKRMLDAGDGLVFSTGKLHTKERSAQRELESAIAMVLAGGAERPLSVRRARGSQLTIIVTPMAVDASDTLGRSARAIVFISDPDLVPENAGTRVAALYGLTRSEAEIAQGIASGKDIGDIAKIRGTRLSTARTQLKTLMSKIGASRQSDVVRSLLAVSILDAR
jgi:DNA-binding CsgD family transcriptional regulator